MTDEQMRIAELERDLEASIQRSRDLMGDLAAARARIKRLEDVLDVEGSGDLTGQQVAGVRKDAPR